MEIEEKIIKAANDGKIFDVILEEFLVDRKEKKVLGVIISKLHNQGAINILSLFCSLKKNDKRKGLFSLINILASALPNINDTVENTVKTINHLLSMNTANDVLLESFKDFCQKDKVRPKELLEIALKDVSCEVDFLSIAISVGVKFDLLHYTNIAIEIIVSENNLLCQRAMLSLGKISLCNNDEVLESSITTIQNKLLSCESDLFFSIGLRSLFNLTRHNVELRKQFLLFFKRPNKSKGKKYLLAASAILFINRDNVSEEECNFLLDICKSVTENDTQAIINIDYVLMSYLKNDDLSRATDFIDSFFERTNYESSILIFDDFSRELLNHNKTHLSSLLTKWLLSKKVVLGRYCLDLFDEVSGDDVQIEVDLDQIPASENYIRIFLARKICGWFYHRPISAVSFMLSLLKGASEVETQEIVELIFNPLLISYPGKVKNYLNGLESENQEITAVLLDRLEVYHAGLNKLQGTKELDVPTSHKQAFYRKRSEDMAISYRKAEKNSLVSMLGIKRSVILYGSGTIHYVHRGEGLEPSREENIMASISTKVEYPTLGVVDPHGLDQMLQYFRLEGCTS
jgi:hypothetical protein